MPPRLQYFWRAGDIALTWDLVYVDGTDGQRYRFGDHSHERLIDLPGFYIAATPTTQALWQHLMGDNPALHRGDQLPLENVSWDSLHAADGFLDRLNASGIRATLSAPDGWRFRLPTETEWEYAARGGPHWRDGFAFSGSNEIEAVAWHDRRDGHTHPVASKAANQLGLYDMSGNVWEWCQDVYTPRIASIPADGTPYTQAGLDRVLRGGCFHNWAIHCTVNKRYAIASDAHDGCIGFRVVLAPA